MHHDLRVAELILDDTCHTLGGVLQEYCHEDHDINFVAYRVLHPLERRVGLKIATENGTIEDALTRVLGHIRRDLVRMQKEVQAM